jgi:hypothetical protein
VPTRRPGWLHVAPPCGSTLDPPPGSRVAPPWTLHVASTWFHHGLHVAPSTWLLPAAGRPSNGVRRDLTTSHNLSNPKIVFGRYYGSHEGASAPAITVDSVSFVTEPASRSSGHPRSADRVRVLRRDAGSPPWRTRRERAQPSAGPLLRRPREPTIIRSRECRGRLQAPRGHRADPPEVRACLPSARCARAAAATSGVDARADLGSAVAWRARAASPNSPLSPRRVVGSGATVPCAAPS